MYLYIYVYHLYDMYLYIHVTTSNNRQINPKIAETQTFVSPDASLQVAAVGSVHERVTHIKAAWQRKHATRKTERWFFKDVEKWEI